MSLASSRQLLSQGLCTRRELFEILRSRKLLYELRARDPASTPEERDRAILQALAATQELQHFAVVWSRGGLDNAEGPRPDAPQR